MSKVLEDAEEDYIFQVRDGGIQRQPARSIPERGLMVDMGATSHIVTDITKFRLCVQARDAHGRAGRWHPVQRGRSAEGKC